MHRCGIHNYRYASAVYDRCPICDPRAQHPDPESAITSLKTALDGLYPRRWADAYEDQHADALSEVAKKAHELAQMVEALNQDIDWPEPARPAMAIADE